MSPRAALVVLLAFGVAAWREHLGPFAPPPPPVDRRTALDAAMEQEQLRQGHTDKITCVRIANQPYDGQHHACFIIETTTANAELPAVIDIVDYVLDGSWTILDVSHF